MCLLTAGQRNVPPPSRLRNYFQNKGEDDCQNAEHLSQQVNRTSVTRARSPADFSTQSDDSLLSSRRYSGK
jgi:hypothetical protein